MNRTEPTRDAEPSFQLHTNAPIEDRQAKKQAEKIDREVSIIRRFMDWVAEKKRRQLRMERISFRSSRHADIIGKPSLRDKILAAKNERHLASLLAVGRSFVNANNGTIGKWKKAAEKRRSDLHRESQSTQNPKGPLAS